jgi:hypothetical protein
MKLLAEILKYLGKIIFCCPEFLVAVHLLGQTTPLPGHKNVVNVSSLSKKGMSTQCDCCWCVFWLNLFKFTCEVIKSPTQRSLVSTLTEERKVTDIVLPGMGIGRRRLNMHNAVNADSDDDSDTYSGEFVTHAGNYFDPDELQLASCMTIDSAEEALRLRTGGPLHLVAVHEAWMGDAPTVEDLMAGMIFESEHIDPDVLDQQDNHDNGDHVGNGRQENVEFDVACEGSELSDDGCVFSGLQVSAVRISEGAAGDDHLC